MSQFAAYETIVSNLEEAGLWNQYDTTMQGLALEIQMNPCFMTNNLSYFGLHPRCIDELTEKLQPLTKTRLPVILTTCCFIDPVNISDCGSFKPLFKELVKEINVAYQYGLYDACALLCRRIIETLLIKVFEYISKSDEIINSENGRAINLSAMIGKANSGVHFQLDSDTKSALDIICKLGNNGAHGQFITLKKKHIDMIKDSIDSAVNELLDRAGIHHD